MSFVYFLVIFQVITILVCFMSLFVMLNRNLELQQRMISYVLFGCNMVNSFILVELVAQGNERTMYVAKCSEIMGMSVFMICLLVLTGYVCRTQVPVWFSAVLLLFDAIFVTMAFANRFLGNLFFEDTKIMNFHGYEYMQVFFGAAGILYVITCIIFPYIACLLMIILAIARDENRLRRKEFSFLLLLYVLNIAVSLAYNSGFFPKFYDPTIPMATYVFCYLVFSKWKYHGLDVVSAAAKTAVDSIDAGIITLNQYREVIYYNQAAARMSSDLPKLMGHSISELQMLQEGVDLEAGDTVEINFNDHKYFVQTSNIYDDKGGVRGYAILMNDMTDMFSMITAIQEEKEKANEAVQAKNEFLENVSNEIKEPLSTVVGLSELIIEESRGRKVYDMAVSIKKASVGLMELVGNIIDYSKIEEEKIVIENEEYSPVELLNDYSALIQLAALQAGLKFKSNIADGVPGKLMGDEKRLRQVLSNIISNSIKNGSDGIISMDIFALNRGSKCTLTITILDATNGNPLSSGFNLGLQISEKLASLMGGEMVVEQVHGEGIKFVIRLVQDIVDVNPTKDKGKKLHGENVENRMFEADETKCLVVDDNKVNVMLLKELLREYKIRVDTTVNGAEAIELCKTKNYDIILMDHIMPDVDGMEATKQIREHYNQSGVQPYIIALTSNNYAGAKDLFLQHSFDDFVDKPVEKKKLHKILLRAIPESDRSFTTQILVSAKYTEEDLARLYMPGVDVRGALKKNGMDVEDYLNILQVYLDEGQQRIGDFTKFYEEKNYREYEILAHGLKSTSLNIGAMELADEASRHELAAKAENFEYVDENITVILQMYSKILDEVQRVLGKKI